MASTRTTDKDLNDDYFFRICSNKWCCPDKIDNAVLVKGQDLLQSSGNFELE